MFRVFRRFGTVIQISPIVFILNVTALYAFFFITDEIIRRLGTTERGFFCVDPSIHYPPRHSSVTSLQHRIYNISLTVVAVFFVEGIRLCHMAPRALRLVYRVGKMEISKYFVFVLTFIGYSQIGYIVNELLVMFVKGFVGRLRPSFHEICNPLPISACDNLNPNTYIEEYTCTGDPEDVEEARKSFYSGHSTVSMYCAFWTVLYLQARLKPALRNTMIVAILQTIIMTIGLYIACSRISDNKHHWSDVIVGIIVGMCLALASAAWWGKVFQATEVGEDVEDELKSHENRKNTV